MNYETIFRKTKDKNHNEVISIKEVPTSEIEKLGSLSGFNGVVQDKGQIKSIDIFIDQNLKYDDKLSVLHHELGHANYILRLGWDEIQKMKKENIMDWEITNEFRAFENELIEALKLSTDDNKELLSKVTKRFEDRMKHEVSATHKEALLKIQSSPIWKQCQECLKSNTNG